MKRGYGCLECLKTKNCYRSRPGYIICSSGIFKYRHPIVTTENVNHILSIIKKDLVLTLLNTKSILSEYRKNDLMSESLKDYYKQAVTQQEAFVFIDVIDAFDTYIKKYIKEEGEDIVKLVSFVVTVMFTAIRVVDDYIEVFSENEDIRDVISNLALAKGYKCRIIKDKEEADGWWVPIMREN